MTTRGKFEGRHSELTGKILGAFFQIHKELGYGFSEKVYQGALATLLAEQGMKVAQQVPIKVYYHGRVIGEYIADMVVDDVVLLELKSVEKLIDVHAAQLLKHFEGNEYRSRPAPQLWPNRRVPPKDLRQRTERLAGMD